MCASVRGDEVILNARLEDTVASYDNGGFTIPSWSVEYMLKHCPGGAFTKSNVRRECDDILYC